MSTVQLSKNVVYSMSWQAAEIADLLDRFIETKDIDCLYSAEFELKNLIDFVQSKHDPNDPPF